MPVSADESSIAHSISLDDPRNLLRKGTLARLGFLMMGVVFNMIAIFAVVFGFIYSIHPKALCADLAVDTLGANSAAAVAGVQRGDRIIAIGGESVHKR